MARKFSPQSKEAFIKAAARYNSMLTRANNKFDITTPAERIVTGAALESLQTTEELKQLTKQLNTFKNLSDFKPAENMQVNVSKGEVKVYKKATFAEMRKARKEIKIIESKLTSAPPATLIDLAHEKATAEAKLTFAQKRISSLKTMKNKDLFKKDIIHSSRRLLKFDAGGFSTYQQNYIKRVQDLASESGVNADLIIDKLRKMTTKQFAAWVQGSPERNLEYKYGGAAAASLQSIADELDLESQDFETYDDYEE